MTLVIVGILAAVAAPRFFDRQTFDVRGFTDQTRAMLRYAQKMAIAQNRPVYVTMSSSRTALCFNALCSSATAAANLVPVPGSGNSGSSATQAACIAASGYSSSWYCESVPSGVTLTLPAALTAGFYFDPLGQPYAASDATNTTTASSFTGATLSISGDGSSHPIVIERDTGYVH